MIGYVRGIVTHLFKESCYVDVHGVGYRVYVPTTTRQQLTEGHEATLFTYLNVREDAMQLYGFWTEEEYELFILLISVSGIGPKVGLGINVVDGRCDEKAVHSRLRRLCWLLVVGALRLAATFALALAGLGLCFCTVTPLARFGCGFVGLIIALVLTEFIHIIK